MDARYPIGRFEWSGDVSTTQRELWIKEIEEFPEELKKAVSGFTPQQLELTYREGGWNVRQLVHHLADSHMNSLTRFKLALTEQTPTIKPYYEDRWAELGDVRNGDIEISLVLLEMLHRRWGLLLRSMTDDDFARSFIHPDSGETLRLDYSLGNYVWHGNHHLAHIKLVRDRLLSEN